MVCEQYLTVLVDRDDPIRGSFGEDAIPLLSGLQVPLDPLPFEELADLVAKSRRREGQLQISRAGVRCEKLHDAKHLSGPEDRKAEGAAESALRGRAKAREVRVGLEIGDPGRLSRGPDPARQADSLGKENTAAQRFKRVLPGC